MTPETELISCPACEHLLRVPLDWLGTQVQCPECKALFRAPVRVDGRLTEPELLARPDSAGAPPVRKRPDLMLLIPAFGLLLCGIAGGLVNGVLLYQLLTDPTGGKAGAKNQIDALRQAGIGKVEPEKQAEKDEQEAGQLVRLNRWTFPLALLVSTVVLAGGLSILGRRYRGLAAVACVLASVNLLHCCCVPGAVFGLWGLLMLNSDEGREHFLR
jgi:hypothetical protein